MNVFHWYMYVYYWYMNVFHWYMYVFYIAYDAYKKAALQLMGQKVMTVATGAFAAQM